MYKDLQRVGRLAMRQNHNLVFNVGSNPTPATHWVDNLAGKMRNSKLRFGRSNRSRPARSKTQSH